MSFSRSVKSRVYCFGVSDTKVDRLARVPLFSGCGKRELYFLAFRMDEASLTPGQVVIHEGQPAETFYILVSGNVEVTRQGKKAARLGPGDFFGEISMLTGGPATATVTADGPVEVLVLRHGQFQDAIKANPALAGQVIAAMAERLRANAIA